VTQRWIGLISLHDWSSQGAQRHLGRGIRLNSFSTHDSSIQAAETWQGRKHSSSLPNSAIYNMRWQSSQHCLPSSYPAGRAQGGKTRAQRQPISLSALQRLLTLCLVLPDQVWPGFSHPLVLTNKWHAMARTRCLKLVHAVNTAFLSCIPKASYAPTPLQAANIMMQLQHGSKAQSCMHAARCPEAHQEPGKRRARVSRMHCSTTGSCGRRRPFWLKRRCISSISSGIVSRMRSGMRFMSSVLPLAT
jgi:hypothetical protein